MILTAAALVAGLSSCDGGLFDSNRSNDEYVPVVLTRAQEEVAAKELDFGIDLFSDIASQESGNVMISPFSASLCLSLIASGAEGDTYAQMASALGFEGFTSEQIGSYYSTMVDALLKADKGTKLAVANAVWAAEGLDIRSEYVSEVKQYYKAKVDNLDFSKSSSVKTINKWCSDNTNGMIKKILDDVDPMIRVVLANALYFKGTWQGGPFDDSNMEFRSISGSTASVKSFSGTKSVQSYFGKDVSVISLPYGNGAFNMIIVLPAEGTDFNAFVKSLSADKWNSWRNSLSSARVEFRIPTFKSEYRMADNFKAALGRLGMVLPFSAAADFSRMCSAESLYVSDIIQKTAIDVNAKGTEAAAVTIGMMKCTSAGPEDLQYFIADRPFVYAIVEQSCPGLLFIGTHVK